jgi:hypothetical protein
MTSEPELPPDLDPRHTRRTGASVIEHGLPGLPEVLTYQMSIPVAYWRAPSCAVVLFLRFEQWDGKFWPKVTMGTYFRDGERWTAHRMWAGKSWPHDPIAKPDTLRDLAGKTIGSSGGASTKQAEPGYPAAVAIGRAASTVKQIALIQNGHQDRRPLESHFGAWTVCTDKPGPYDVAAFDEHGAMLATLQHPFPPPRPPGPTPDGTHHSP